MNLALDTELVENFVFSEIKLGQSARLLRTLTMEDISAFAAVSGDTNPAHLDSDYANDTLFHGLSLGVEELSQSLLDANDIVFHREMKLLI